MMNSRRHRMVAGPDDILRWIDLHHRDALVCRVAANHRVPIRETLRTTRVLEQTVHILVGDFPNDFTPRTEFSQFIAVCERYDGVAIVQSDRGEWPIFRRTPPNSSKSVRKTRTIFPSGVYSLIANASKCGTR